MSLEPIRTLFIANRGEIAARITRTASRLGIRVVVPGLDGTPAVDLLDIQAVVAQARSSGADALHPGFGFLSENADFAAAVEAAGIRWVGPPSRAIRAMGDKASARRLAVGLGIPVVPGYDGDDQSDEALLAAASEIARPGPAYDVPPGRHAVRPGQFAVLIKPAAGGGGKGMRTIAELDPPDAFLAGLATARREASAAFGDPRLILERLVAGPRHVEIQVLFDSLGHGVHLGERDSSIQRRHQKILEESPSPAVGQSLRRRLGRAALELAGSVGYRSAGTCEFLLDDDGSFYFLEMNTRLQVEHPVTELVSGRDLVADQLRITAGEPLGFSQADADAARASGGHAIEVRLYAEDPVAGFLPSTGTVSALRWPEGERIRVDAGIGPGSIVDTRFDPMLAKIIAGGRNRAEALANLRAALAQTVVLGLITNLRFLRWLLDQPAVVDGEARIDTLEAIWPPSVGPDETRAGETRADETRASGSPSALAWLAAAQALAGGS
ncbi:MAG: biotin carboxylase N-terminal domain-containing protein, partial [Candidatus Limnocylindrales bacterium]